MGLSALAAPCPGPDCVEIGSNGGTVSVESDLDILFNNGGGHVTWRISGEAAPELRRLIDKNYGNNDGNITPAEAAQYTTALDNTLTLTGAVYHGAKLQSFSLLDRNRGVEDNSEFLIGKDNDTRTIEIRFLLEATLSTPSQGYSLSDDIMVRALFDALKTSYDIHSYLYVGKVSLSHTNYIVSMSSYSDFNVDHGRVIRFRGPMWEIYQYSVSYDKGTMGNAKDKAQFGGTDSFNVLESPMELFILLVALGYLMLYFPRRFAKTGRKQRMKALHRAIWGFLILLFIVYMIGAPGGYVWFLSPLTFGCVVGFSYMLYIKGWKGYAKPLSLAESRDLDREEGIVRPESYRKLQPKRYYEDEGQSDEGDGYPPEEEAQVRRAPGPSRQAPPEEDYGPVASEDEGGPLEEEPAPPPRRPPPRLAPQQRPQVHRPAPVERPAPRPQAPRATPQPVPQVPKPAPKPARPSPTAPPGPPVNVIKRKIRCVQCKQIFEAEIRTKPQRIECPMCGKVGMIK
jgi:DNA-directed RNA polymerase subunit RPC12/RpoP